MRDNAAQMPLLYYWRPDNYARDRRLWFGYHLNQSSPAMLSARPGDSLWAFTRRERDGQYVLAAGLVVRAVTTNLPHYWYGRYRIWGDLVRSRYFDIDVAPNAEPLIRPLQVKAAGQRLGQAFQGHAAVRILSHADHQVLVAFALYLPALDRVALYPDDEFEARLIHGEAARSLVLREDKAQYGRRLKYVFEPVDLHRARQRVERLQELSAGRCQVCLYDPRTRYGYRLCHAHHIQWLSRGGEDERENMVLVCPNHHAAIHRDDPPFDYASLTFRFSNGTRERLALNQHLPVATRWRSACCDDGRCLEKRSASRPIVFPVSPLLAQERCQALSQASPGSPLTPRRAGALIKVRTCVLPPGRRGGVPLVYRLRVISGMADRWP